MLAITQQMRFTENGWCNAQERWIVGSNPDRVKPKIIKLVFVASLLTTQH
jgi:hypothetical protein